MEATVLSRREAQKSMASYLLFVCASVLFNNYILLEYRLGILLINYSNRDPIKKKTTAKFGLGVRTVTKYKQSAKETKIITR